MKIKSIDAHEIFDSRGILTIEVILYLNNNSYVVASVPSGISRSTHEAHELRDNKAHSHCQGVHNAINNINTIIAPLLIGKQPDFMAIDSLMIALDNENKSTIGANSMLAVSIAVAKAQALTQAIPLHSLIANLCDNYLPKMPIPMLNIAGGGLHADNNCTIQEFLIIPTQAASFIHAMQQSAQVFYSFEMLLKSHRKSTATGYEGEYIPYNLNEIQILDLILEAIEKTHMQDNIMIGLDCAASHFYNQKTQKYRWNNDFITGEALINYYENLIKKYPIYSIEDGLAENDIKNWTLLTKKLSSKVLIIGDDLFATHADLIDSLMKKNVATGCVIKPNQVGTISQTIKAIKKCHQYNIPTISSHRSGETNDTFIADFAIGSNALHIKAGGLSHGERVAKYNHLIWLEKNYGYKIQTLYP